MPATAKKTDPALWRKVKDAVTQSERGGRAGQWSARKAQLAVQDYKKLGGGYEGSKTDDNHLHQWTREEWGTQSGKASTTSGERYLPKRARERLTQREYAETTAKKRDDTRKGKQFSAQPPTIAKKTAKDRIGASSAHSRNAELTRVELMAKAGEIGIAGRSRMSKADLLKALG